MDGCQQAIDEFHNLNPNAVGPYIKPYSTANY